MKKLSVLFVLLCFISSCGNNFKKPKRVNKKRHKVELNKKSNGGKHNALQDFDVKNVSRSTQLNNGIQIHWFQETFKRNPKLKDGDVCLINYRVTLPDGKIFDGSNRLNLPFIPFIVGYNMQFKGWDIAIKQLKVGDFAKIELPSELAYGKTGFSNIVPPNSKIWLYVKVIAKVKPDYDHGGIKTWVFDKGASSQNDQAEQKEIVYHCISSSKNKADIENSYRRKLAFRYVLGQKNVVPGLQKVFPKVKKGQKIFVLLSPKQAYGANGYANIVGPNEEIFYNLTIEDILAL